MKVLVVYDSKYGCTRQYAHWIAESCGGVCKAVEHCTPADLKGADSLLFGGGLYAGKIKGTAWFKKNRKNFSGKKVGIFFDGLTAPEDYSVIEKVIQANFPAEKKSGMKFFYLPGKIEYTRLNWVHRMMMAVMKKGLEAKAESDRTEADKSLLSTYGVLLDKTDRNRIKPILDFIKGAE